MLVDEDDPMETNVSPTTANMLFAIDPKAAPDEKTVQDRTESADLGDLGSLFRDHYKGIFRVSYRITGSESDAEDVLQTIFVRLTKGWNGRDLSPNPRAFLYRAAINASLDIVRLRKRANSISLDVIDFDQSSTTLGRQAPPMILRTRNFASLSAKRLQSSKAAPHKRSCSAITKATTTAASQKF